MTNHSLCDNEVTELEQYNYYLSPEGELYHYGVLGMKWGVRRARRAASRNVDLGSKALKYDKKAAVYTKKSEKAHAEIDLERSNRAAVKAAKYNKKAATTRKKSLNKSDTDQLDAERKAAKLEYKATKQEAKASRLSKGAGYGAKAMNYSIKSDKVAIKAAKARAKMAKNNAYIDMMNRRMDSLDADTRRRVETSMIEYLKKNEG